MQKLVSPSGIGIIAHIKFVQPKISLLFPTCGGSEVSLFDATV